MANDFDIQHYDNFYFGAPPTDFAVLGASSSPEFQYETPMTGNPNFGRALASDFGASMADFGAYATDLGVSPANFESPPLIQPMSSNFPPPMSYHYDAPPPMSTNYGGQPINDSSEQSFMSSQGESFYQDSFYQDSNFGVHQQSNTNFGYSSSRTVLVKIHSELYPISHEVLDWFFSGIGKLESIECFDQWNPFHSRICFQDSDSAVRAVHWLDGSCIYNGCCQVELILEAETIDRANEMDVVVGDGVVEEMGGPNQRVAEDSIVHQSSDENKNHDMPVEALRILGQRHQLIERANRTILIKIRFELYPVSGEVLDQIFSGIGNLETIEIFDQGNPFHSRICFKDQDAALRAIDCCNGMFIYDGCFCQMELSLYVRDKLNEMEVIDTNVHSSVDLQIQPDQFSEMLAKDNIQGSCEFWEIKAHKSVQIENESSVMDDLKANILNEVSSPHVIEEIAETSNPLPETEVVCGDNEEPSIEVSESLRNIGRELEAFSESGITLPHIVVVDSEVEIEEVSKEPGIQFEFSKVNSYLPDVVVDELAWEEEELVDNSTAIVDFGMKSIACLGIFNAYKVFAEMPRRVVGVFDPGIVVFCVNHNFSYPVCFGPGGVVYEFSWNDIPFDRGKVVDAMMYSFQFVRMPDVCQVENGNLVGKMGSAEVELKIGDTLLSKNSVERNAYKVFEEMPNKKFVLFGLSVCIKDKAMLGVRVEIEIAEAMLVARHNKGVQLRIALADEWVSAISEKQGVVIPAYGCIHPIVFDPGGIHCLDGEVGEGRVINLDNSSDQLGRSSVMDVLNVQLGLVEYSFVVDGSVDTYRILGVILIFDPGGVLVLVSVGMCLLLSITNGFALRKDGNGIQVEKFLLVMARSIFLTCCSNPKIIRGVLFRVQKGEMDPRRSC